MIHTNHPNVDDLSIYVMVVNHPKLDDSYDPLLDDSEHAFKSSEIG